MKNPGQPETPPSWYRPREASPIENDFVEELGDLANKIEQEHWFGDKGKHSRLIIELDGHAYHSSKEQLEKDAIRQRYLTRSGYSVIRFTGREIYRNAAACVEEVHTLYTERIQREPAKYRIMYVDYTFLKNEILSAYRFFCELHPGKKFKQPNIEDVILSGIEWLHERSFITVQVFHSDKDTDEVESIYGILKEFEKGEVRITCQEDSLYVCALCDHLEAYTHLYDDFLIMADDLAYISPLKELFESSNGKLLRRGNHESLFNGTDLMKVNWQNIYYPIGHAFGLELFEM